MRIESSFSDNIYGRPPIVRICVGIGKSRFVLLVVGKKKKKIKVFANIVCGDRHCIYVWFHHLN